MFMIKKLFYLECIGSPSLKSLLTIMISWIPWIESLLGNFGKSFLQEYSSKSIQFKVQFHLQLETSSFLFSPKNADKVCETKFSIFNYSGYSDIVIVIKSRVLESWILITWLLKWSHKTFGGDESVRHKQFL